MAEYAAALEDVADGAFPSLHQIQPGLWLGDQSAAGVLLPFQLRETPELRDRAREVLAGHGITHVVCVSADEGEEQAQPFRDSGITYLCCKLQDGDAAAVASSAATFGALLAAAVPFIAGAVAGGGGVLVHCASGAHRSSSVVVGYLMATRHETLAAAFPRVFHRRPIALPVYWQYLLEVWEPRVLQAGKDAAAAEGAAAVSAP